MKRLSNLLIITAMVSFLASCGVSSENKDAASEESTSEVQSMVEEAPDPMENKGIGPISSVTLGELNQEMADLGAEKFKALCSACHKVDKKFIGPSPQGVLDRRSPEWVMNMILNPQEMVTKDPLAKDLLAEFNGSPMANQGLTEEQARASLEYFRTL